MIETIIASIQATFLAGGVLGIFVLAFLQEIIPPIPSTLVAVTAGFIFVSGMPISLAGFAKLFWFVGLPIAGGLTLGALIVYGIVYWGGRPVVEKWGSKFGVSWDDIERLQGYMKGHRKDDVIMFGARAFPLIPSLAINVFSGIVRWPPVSFTLHTFFGTIIRAMWSGFIGWQFVAVYVRYAHVVENINTSVIIVLIVAVVGFLIWRRHKTARATLKTGRESEE